MRSILSCGYIRRLPKTFGCSDVLSNFGDLYYVTAKIDILDSELSQVKGHFIFVNLTYNSAV